MLGGGGERALHYSCCHYLLTKRRIHCHTRDLILARCIVECDSNDVNDVPRRAIHRDHSNTRTIGHHSKIQHTHETWRIGVQCSLIMNQTSMIIEDKVCIMRLALRSSNNSEEDRERFAIITTTILARAANTSTFSSC